MLTPRSSRLDDLSHTFKYNYGFETETWTIPTAESHIILMEKAVQFVQEFGRPENLLIVYYGGHWLLNASRQALWTW